jgi:predicted nucleic acid-binding protein
VILPDVNLLLHAYDHESPLHPGARQWWESALSSTRPVGLAWAAVLGLIRIATHRHVFTNPLPVTVACAYARTWLALPYVSIVHPGQRHAEILFRFWSRLAREAISRRTPTWRRSPSSIRPSCTRPTPTSSGSRACAG